jgi:hypothetical protein
MHDAPFFKDRYEANGGPLVRLLADFYDHTYVGIAIDTGVDQSFIWNNWSYNAMAEDWENGRYFLMPTTEIQEQWRFKLTETAPDIFLYSGEKQPLPVVKKGGCPFGFT